MKDRVGELWYSTLYDEYHLVQQSYTAPGTINATKHNLLIFDANFKFKRIGIDSEYDNFWELYSARGQIV